MRLHDVVHVLLLGFFLTTISTGFLGLIRPLVGGGSDLRLPGPKLTALCFFGALASAAGDWLVHRYVL